MVTGTPELFPKPRIRREQFTSVWAYLECALRNAVRHRENTNNHRNKFVSVWHMQEQWSVSYVSSPVQSPFTSSYNHGVHFLCWLILHVKNLNSKLGIAYQRTESDVGRETRWVSMVKCMRSKVILRFTRSTNSSVLTQPFLAVYHPCSRVFKHFMGFLQFISPTTLFSIW